MNSSQMEKYVWATALYYAVAAFGFLGIFISICLVGFFPGLLALFGYLMLLIVLKAWRLRRHPRSAYQVELTKQSSGG